MGVVGDMCNDDSTVSSPITIGGPTGDYVIECPIPGLRYEFKVVGLAAGDNGPCTAIVSGDMPPLTAKFDGSTQLGGNTPTTNQNSFIRGYIYRLQATIAETPSEHYAPISDGQKKVYIRIDTPNSGTSMYVTVQFKIHPIKVIPSKPVTVPAGLEQQHNIARAHMTVKRLNREHIGSEG